MSVTVQKEIHFAEAGTENKKQKTCIKALKFLMWHVVYKIIYWSSTLNYYITNYYILIAIGLGSVVRHADRSEASFDTFRHLFVYLPISTFFFSVF